MPLMPREGEWTVDDLDLLPEDDGLRYELLDGVLLVTPAPTWGHQHASRELFLLLHALTPPGLELYYAPFAFEPDVRSSLEPDLVLFEPGEATEKAISRLVLAIEILSPSSRRFDQVLKRSKYEDSGVQHYWIVDPEEPSVLALRLQDGHYTEVGRAKGDDALSLTEPFPVTLVPASLVRR